MHSWSTESWIAVPDFDRYEVSNLGRVRSVDYTNTDTLGRRLFHRGTVLQPVPDQDGYLRVTLYNRVRKQVLPIHRIVLTAFTGPCPAGMEGCHRNGDHLDNTPGNLRWGSDSSNVRDMVRHGRHHCVQRNHCPRGHDLVEPNLIISTLRQGRRSCLACRRAKAAQRNAKLAGKAVPEFEPLADKYYELIMAGAA